jgi:hypothetical protein
MFELFTTYDPELGLDDLLARLDVTDIQPRNVYHAILGRRPESLAAARIPEDYIPRDHLRGTLRSSEFQRKSIRLMLDAYPEKRRLLFVHVPKCAGTDLRIGLSTRYPALDLGLPDPEWTTGSRLFEALHDAVLGLHFSDTLLLHGHVRIVDCVDRNIVRPTDTIITVIRDPAEIVLSNINYILTRILQDQEAGKRAPDTQGWLRLLQIERLDHEMRPHVLMPLVKTMLRHSGITRPNSICYWLGNGDVQSVVRRLVINDVEITDAPNYSAWLHSRWGIAREAKANESRKFVTLDQLDADDHTFIESVTAEDRLVYNLLSPQIATSPLHAVTGTSLAGIERFN